MVRALRALSVLVFGLSTEAAAQPLSKEWPASKPEAVGLDAKVLAAFDADIAGGKYGYVDSMLVIRHGKIAYERRYAHDYDKTIAQIAQYDREITLHPDVLMKFNDARDFAKSVSLTPKEAERHGLALNKDGQRRSAFELLSYPNIAMTDLAKVWPRFAELDSKVAEQIEIDAKYDVYLSRQAADVAAYRRDESFTLPDDLDYENMRGLSNEAKQKLQHNRPRTIGHASKIDGITPAALTLLVAHVKRGKTAKRA